MFVNMRPGLIGFNRLETRTETGVDFNFLREFRSFHLFILSGPEPEKIFIPQYYRGNRRFSKLGIVGSFIHNCGQIGRRN